MTVLLALALSVGAGRSMAQVAQPGAHAEQAVLQAEQPVLNDAKPPIQDGGERSGPSPTAPHPMAFGILFGLLVIGAGLGLTALVVIRRWDRNRPIERETERHAAAKLPPQPHV
ncbi:MAG: hypothetical protein ABI629_15130 [bacterium]